MAKAGSGMGTRPQRTQSGGWERLGSIPAMTEDDCLTKADARATIDHPIPQVQRPTIQPCSASTADLDCSARYPRACVIKH